jgi:MYXO-CTERM domain-containing protein
MPIRTPAAVASRLGLLSSGLAIAAGCGMVTSEDSLQVGEVSAPIVGGASTTQYPAVPLLYSETAESEGAQLCSGTLISPRVILTAAHCVEFVEGEPTAYVAYFGSDVTVRSDPERIGAVDVASYVFHPDWDINNLEGGHDIGLVLLQQRAPVDPMPFNRKPLDDLVGQEVHLVGWGRTNGIDEDFGVKREVRSTLQGANSLLMQYGSASANTCQGDSGGPNFMNIDGVEVVAGITSFGNVGCDQYGFGTRVDVFAESFIDPFIAANDPDAIPVGGDDDGDGDDQGGEDGSEAGEGGSDPVTGGCTAAGESSRSFWSGLLVMALVVARRRRRTQSVSHR